MNHSLKTFINPYSYLHYRRNSRLFSAFEIFCDGLLLAKLLNIFYSKSICRASFDMTSMAPQVLSKAEKYRLNLYFVGGPKGVAELAGDNLMKRFSKLSIIGSVGGYFDSQEERQLAISRIVDASPNIVIVGMGTPLQEQFLVDLWQAGWRGEGYTCGGFLHQTAKRGTTYYPKWIDQLHLRWAYRIYDEPKLFKRYFLLYPLSVFLFIYDRFMQPCIIRDSNIR